MEIKLNVYKSGEIVKTYRTETYEIMFGTVEDLLGVIDFDKIQKGTDTEVLLAVTKAIPKVFGLVKPLLKDVFPGITDDELKNCRVKEIAKVLIDIAKFTISDIGAGNSKN